MQTQSLKIIRVERRVKAFTVFHSDAATGAAGCFASDSATRARASRSSVGGWLTHVYVLSPSRVGQHVAIGRLRWQCNHPAQGRAGRHPAGPFEHAATGPPTTAMHHREFIAIMYMQQSMTTMHNRSSMLAMTEG